MFIVFKNNLVNIETVDRIECVYEKRMLVLYFRNKVKDEIKWRIKEGYAVDFLYRKYVDLLKSDDSPLFNLDELIKMTDNDFIEIKENHLKNNVSTIKEEIIIKETAKAHIINCYYLGYSSLKIRNKLIKLGYNEWTLTKINKFLQDYLKGKDKNE